MVNQEPRNHQKTDAKQAPEQPPPPPLGDPTANREQHAEGHHEEAARHLRIRAIAKRRRRVRRKATVAFILQIVGAFATVAIAGLTAVYVHYSDKQWRAMEEANTSTREALTSVQRAFITRTAFSETKVQDEAHKVLGWDFAAIWENSGTTPAISAKSHISWTPTSNPLPDNFPFSDLWTADAPKENISFVLGPKAVHISDHFRIAPQDIWLVQTKHAHFYVWGSVRYKDIFKNTPIHITEFCSELTDFGDNPFKPTSDTPPVVMRDCTHHNCTDDDCNQK